MDELTHDKQQLVTNDDICLSVVEVVADDLPDPDNFDGDEVVSVIKSMKDEIQDLKNQIPKKPRKCFSYNDKKVLESLLDDVECLSQAQDQGSPLCISGGFDAKKKLIERLLK